MPVKAKKISGVVFITLLIWAWAYLALETQDVQWGTLDISNDARPDLLVSFPDEPEIPVQVSIELKGPNSKITELQKRLREATSQEERLRFDFYYNPQNEGHTEPGEYLWDVVSFLKDNEEITSLGLSVVDCSVKTIRVKIEKLVKKTLSVECLDENDLAVQLENPVTVSMFVTEEFSGSAIVKLISGQMEQAHTRPLSVNPYVILGGKKVYSETAVTVKLPSKADRLETRIMQLKRIGYLFNKEMAGEYIVELQNESKLAESIAVRGTEQALDAYQNQIYQILIQVESKDKNETDVAREVIYNVPQEYLRKSEIELPAPREAKFKLVPVSPEVVVP